MKTRKNFKKIIFSLVICLFMVNNANASIDSKQYQTNLNIIENKIKNSKLQNNTYSTEYLNLQQDLYNLHLEHQNINKAIEVSNDIIEIAQNIDEENTNKIIETYLGQTYLYLMQKEPINAKNSLSKAESLLKKSSNNVLRTKYYQALSDYYATFESYFKALDSLNNIINYYNLTNEEKLNLINKYAISYHGCYNAKEAEKYFKDVYKLNTKLYGIENQDLIYYYQALLNFELIVKSNYNNFLPIYKKLEHLTSKYNANKETILLNKQILISYYLWINHLEEAKAELDKISIDVENTQNNDLKASLYSLYNSYYVKIGDSKNQKKYLKKSKKIFNKTFNKNSVQQVFQNERLIDHYKQIGNYRKATKLSKQTLELLEEQNNTVPVLSGKFLKNMSLIQRDLGNYEEALNYLIKSELSYKQELPNVSYPLYETALEEAIVYRFCEKYNQAIEYYQKAVDICKKLFGENHRDVIYIYKNIAETYAFAGNQELAIKNINKAISIAQKIYEKDNINVYELKFKKVELLEILKQNSTAKEIYNCEFKNFSENKEGNNPYLETLIQKYKIKLFIDDKNYDDALTLAFKIYEETNDKKQKSEISSLISQIYKLNGEKFNSIKYKTFLKNL